MNHQYRVIIINGLKGEKKGPEWKKKLLQDTNQFYCQDYSARLTKCNVSCLQKENVLSHKKDYNKN